MSMGAETRRMPSVPEPPQPVVRSRPQPEPITPASEEDIVEKFEQDLVTRPTKYEKPATDRFDEEFDDIPKRRSFTPVLIAVLVLIIVCAGVFIGYILTQGKKDNAVTATTTPAAVVPTPAQQAPAVPVPPPVSQQPVVAAPTVAPAPTEPVETSRPAPVAQEEKPKPIVKKRTPEPKPVASVKPRATPRPKRTPLEEPEEVASTIEPASSTPEPTSSSSIEIFDEPVAKPVSRPAPPREPEPEPEPEISRKPIISEEPETPSRATPSGSEDAATIFLSSVPPVADVYMDGKLIGKTNVMELKVLSGTHTMRFVKGEKEFTKTMTFQSGKNPSMFIPLK